MKIKIVASDGMVLTNGKSFGRVVFLATGDSKNNWYEITEEQYNQIIENESGE